MEKSRRSFLKILGLGTLAVVVSPLIRLNQTIAGLVTQSDPLVKALGYVPNAKKSKERKDKSATCSKCQFYGDPTGKSKQAKCQLIPTGEVLATGWCRSFSLRPGMEKPAKPAKAKPKKA